jgi:hypothetical protein
MRVKQQDCLIPGSWEQLCDRTEMQEKRLLARRFRSVMSYFFNTHTR